MSSAPIPAETPFRRVAVLGLGVMGGSLARGLARLESPPAVAGWSPDAGERRAAREAGVLDEAPAEWSRAVREADLVVLATPLAAACDLLGEVAGVTDATLTDVGSLKAPVARAAKAAGAADRWVGSHPMAGSEDSGFAASRADLYEGARVWTVAGGAAALRVPEVHAFWGSLGARPELIGVDDHDRLVESVSQLPQLAANALAEVLAARGVTSDQLGPGGLDMTRLAASSADMWQDLFHHASPELPKGLRELAKATERIADLLEAGELETLQELMTSTGAWRRRP